MIAPGMSLGRREFVGAAAAALLMVHARGNAMEELTGDKDLYGRIGELRAMPGKRAELIGYLLDGSDGMDGNLAYIVAKDAGNPDSIWITEIWKDAASHKASLKLPQVQAAIAKARPIIAGFGTSAEVIPVGGKH
ncbi:putative quinol monooxygenase [Novosphingobium lentum]|uniref:putative quinol monooxygenase n=1 Tax=Novosphingobium lentum TaxID=145287 RepID=UPI000A889AB2|nr:putative quinol monooxygenase [Novosphingobium lentum]